MYKGIFKKEKLPLIPKLLMIISPLYTFMMGLYAACSSIATHGGETPTLGGVLFAILYIRGFLLGVFGAVIGILVISKLKK